MIEMEVCGGDGDGNGDSVMELVVAVVVPEL